VDEVISLRFVFNGESRVEPPKAVRAEGLVISAAGSDSYMALAADKRYVAWNYSIIPQKPGSYTIPSLTFTAGTREITTYPVKLTVSNQENSNAMLSGTQAGFAELLLPGSTGQVGDRMLVALRFYYPPNLNIVDAAPFDFGQSEKNGFKVSKLEGAGCTRLTRNGQAYLVETFLCEAMPVKSGKLVFGPVTWDCRVSVTTPEQEKNDPFAKKTAADSKLKHLRLSTTQKEIQVRENADAGQGQAKTTTP